MPIYDIQTPSGKTLSIEAADENAAMTGAQQWHAENGATAETTASSADFSQAKDIATGVGTGLAKGVIGIPGMPADLGSLGQKATDATLGRASRAVLDPVIETIFGVQSGRLNEMRQGAPKPPDLLGSMGSGAIQSGLESVAGAKLPEAQTVPGKYAETLASFVPGGALFGGLNSARRAAAEVVIPALASETAGQATKGTAAEPYARVAAGAVPQLAAGVARARTSAPERAVQGSTSTVTPQQWDAAQELQAAGQRVGVPLSGPEAVAGATGGETRLPHLLRAVEGSTEGGTVSAPFFAARPQQVETAVARNLDVVGPQDPRPSTLGPRASESAQNVLDETQRGINTATRPAYQAAEQHVLDPAAFTPIADDPAFQASLRRLRNDEVLGPTYADLPDNSVAVIDAVTKDMRDRGVALGNAANPGFSSQTAGMYGRGAAEARDIARDPARGGVQAYDDALVAQEQARRQNLTPLEQGPIGQIAGAPNGRGTLNATQAAADSLMPAVPLTGGQGELADATARLVMESAQRDPNMVPSLVRQGLSDRFDQAAQRVQSGRNQFVGAKYANEVVGTPQREANLNAVVGELPNGVEAGPRLAEMFDVLRATGQRRAEGSPTAFNQERLEDLKNLPIAMQAALAPVTAFTSVTRGVRDTAQRAWLGRNTGRLAEMFTAPDAVQQMRVMAERQLGHPISDAMVRQLIQTPVEMNH